MNRKICRNELCPCGSGVKYKRCHGRIDLSPQTPDARQVFARHQAAELIRTKQQGHGRPIIGAKVQDYQIVAVGDKIHWGKTWETFPDFLSYYIKNVLGSAWGNDEIKRPFEERHPLIQWYDTLCRYQQQTIKVPGGVSSADVTGIVASYLGVAYGLYLLAHNVELQDRLVQRLKNPQQFQGAYYELIVANILIRAGFELTLEDETDGETKHCEFAAVSKTTGKRYWVEAKMRSVVGLLGKTETDGTRNPNPLSQLTRHLNGALAKPANDERLVFIDLNAEPTPHVAGKPTWGDAAVRALERYEQQSLPTGMTAYVFVTNMAFHRSLDRPPLVTAMPYGLGIADFNRPGFVRLSEIHRQRQTHQDAFRIGEALVNFTVFPPNFDGSLPSESGGRESQRVLIGETYLFDGKDGKQFAGKVTAASVDEASGQALVGITNTETGESGIYRRNLTEAELADYRVYKEAYFGEIRPVHGQIKTRLDAFNFFISTHKVVPRQELIERMVGWQQVLDFASASDDEILAAYCEGMVGTLISSGFKLDDGTGTGTS